jgi:hypothetical protein
MPRHWHLMHAKMIDPYDISDILMCFLRGSSLAYKAWRQFVKYLLRTAVVCGNDTKKINEKIGRQTGIGHFRFNETKMSWKTTDFKSDKNWWIGTFCLIAFMQWDKTCISDITDCIYIIESPNTRKLMRPGLLRVSRMNRMVHGRMPASFVKLKLHSFDVLWICSCCATNRTSGIWA